MLNDNLWIEESKIPQNENTTYEIHIDPKWKHTINIMIKSDEEVNTFNLFLILKSYSNSLKYPVKEFLVRISKPNDLIITENSSPKMIKNFTFSEFEKWFFYRIKHDEKYMDDKSLYSFSFTYNTRAFNWILLENLKPIYPWKESILVEVRTSETKEYVNEELLNKYKSIIKKVVKENIILKKRIREKKWSLKFFKVWYDRLLKK